MQGGKFQGSINGVTFSDIFTIQTAPPFGQWVEVTISPTTPYRFLRYLSPDGGYCNVAEIEFYGN